MGHRDGISRCQQARSPPSEIWSAGAKERSFVRPAGSLSMELAQRIVLNTKAMKAHHQRFSFMRVRRSQEIRFTAAWPSASAGPARRRALRRPYSISTPQTTPRPFLTVRSLHSFQQVLLVMSASLCRNPPYVSSHTSSVIRWGTNSGGLIRLSVPVKDRLPSRRTRLNSVLPGCSCFLGLSAARAEKAKRR